MQELDYTYYLIDQYTNDLLLRGRRPYTAKTYNTTLRAVTRFLHESGLSVDPRHVTSSTIQYFIDNYPTSENTIKHYCILYKAFLEYNNNNVMKSMNLLWNSNTCPNVKWMTSSDMGHLLSSSLTPTERLVLILGAYCGLRRAEMADLLLSDYDGHTLTIIGKGHSKGKLRVLPLSVNVIKEIDSYLENRHLMLLNAKDEASDHLLVQKAWGTHIRPLLPSTISHMIRDISRRSNVSFTPHSLRRLFATQLSDKTRLEVIQHLMGHANINTTSRYIYRDMNKLKDAMQSLY